MDDVDVAFEPGERKLTARVRAEGARVAELDDHRLLLDTRCRISTSPSCRTREGAYLANIVMEGAAERARGGDGPDQAPRPRVQQGPRDLRGLRGAVPRAVDAQTAVSSSTRSISLSRPEPVRGPGTAGTFRAPWTIRSSSFSTPRRERAGAAGSWPRALAALGPRRRRRAWPQTSDAGDEARLAERGPRRGFRRIVAVGGDGTWSNVGNAILRSGVAASLGLVAGGTGCDLAKSLGIPARDVSAAAGSSWTAGPGPSTWDGSRTSTS